MAKTSACSADAGDPGSILGSGRSLEKGMVTYSSFWRREGLHTQVFLLGESHGQRSLVDYSPWGRKESDTTERPSEAILFPLIYIKAVLSWKC